MDEATAKLDIRKAEAVKQAAARVRKQIAALLQEQRKQQKQTDAKGTSQSQVWPGLAAAQGPLLTVSCTAHHACIRAGHEAGIQLFT